MSIPSKQEMFDKAVRGLRSQNWEKSVIATGACRYRGPGGRRCAWGWVDDAYDAAWEGLDIGGLADKGFGLAALLEEEDFLFAVELQGAHDDPYPRDIQTALRHVGQAYGLIWPEE